MALRRCFNRRARPRDHIPRLAGRFTEREQHGNGKRRRAANAAGAVNQHGFPKLQTLCYVTRKRPKTTPVLGRAAVGNLEVEHRAGNRTGVQSLGVVE